jgi:excisionase family DNA binding protein
VSQQYVQQTDVFLLGPPLPDTRDNVPESKAARRSALPEGTLPRGLSRREAAAYVGVSPTTFDAMVADGQMPKPKHIGTRRVWDRRRVDEAFDELPGDDEHGDHVWGHIA